MPKREKKKSDYSHTIYSNTRSRTKTKNLERHREILKERAERKKNIKKERSETKEKRIFNPKAKNICIQNEISNLFVAL